MGRAYLDWAAGAPLHPEARAAAERALALGAGNPSSVHAEGRAARAILEEARERVAALVGCAPREIVFTASATEANATAVLGVARAALSRMRARGGSAADADRPRLLAGATEHPSVLQAGEAAAREGALFHRVPCDAHGVIRVEAIDRPAALLALQAANNETGVIQPLIEATAAAREAGAHVHCDAVQAAGRLDLHAIWQRCDSLSLSAHKLGGLPGVGALALRRGADLPALVPGHQERGLRGGTHALPAIAAFGAVATIALRERAARSERLAALTERLEALLRAIAPDVVIHGAGAQRVPGIVNARFPGADGETLLVALDLAGIACSHGAACSTGAMEPSHVLLAMGLDSAEARSAIRFSVGPETGDDDLRALEAALPAALRSARIG